MLDVFHRYPPHIWYLAGYGAVLLLVLLTNALTVKLAIAGAALASSYPFFKRFTHVPQVVLGIAFGWGIPMATDIAFVVGCLAVLGPRVPRILRVVLLSLAIVDDIGAILVIIGLADTSDALPFDVSFAVIIPLVMIGLGVYLVWQSRVLERR